MCGTTHGNGMVEARNIQNNSLPGWRTVIRKINGDSCEDAGHVGVGSVSEGIGLLPTNIWKAGLDVLVPPRASWNTVNKQNML